MVLFHYNFPLRITILSSLLTFVEFLRPSLTQLNFAAETSLELLILLLAPAPITGIIGMQCYYIWLYMLLVISKARKERLLLDYRNMAS